MNIHTVKFATGSWIVAYELHWNKEAALMQENHGVQDDFFSRVG